MGPARLWYSTVLFLLTLLITVPSQAQGPTEQIKETTDKILAIVSDPSLKSPDKKEEKIRRLRKVVDERFDWREMSRRTLARHWAERTEEEKEEFIRLFGELLERTYRDKVDSYSGEKVVFVGERVDGDYGAVKVKVVGQDQRDIPVLYRVKKKGNDWLVYDISIEGVSLINNYRSQFNNIIVRSSYDKLIKMLRAKVQGGEEKSEE